MGMVEWILIASGALAAGFVTGLTGFGTALVAAAFWLLVASRFVGGMMAGNLSVATAAVADVIELRTVLPIAGSQQRVDEVV